MRVECGGAESTRKRLTARPSLEVTGGGIGKRGRRQVGLRLRGKERTFPDSLTGRAIPRNPVTCVRCRHKTVAS